MGLAPGFVSGQGAGDAAFSGVMREVQRLHAAGQYEAALKKVTEAEAQRPNHPVLLQARGNIYMGLRDYTQARDWYQKAAAAQPGAFGAQFSLAELAFVEKRYEAAGAAFAQLLQAHAALPEADRQFLQFKVLLCALKRGLVAEADARMKEYVLPENSPARYFSMIAFSIQKGDRTAANEWLAKANAAGFNAAVAERYVDSLVEAQWLALPSPPAATPKK